MKILALSDLNWDTNLHKINSDSVDNFNEKELEKKEYQGIKKYFSLIKKEEPNLVLFAGDITGDGSCGHGYQNAMKILLKILNENKIQTFFISGNHDEVKYYNELITFSNKLKFSKDISNQIIEFNGIKILGISYEKSKKKTELKELIKKHNKKINIVLSHTESKRRTWLFDLDTDFIITGHFDKKLTPIENKIFISLDNDTSQFSYCKLNFVNKKNVEICYFIQEENNRIVFTESLNKLLLNKRNYHYEENGKRKDILIEEKKLVFSEYMDKHEGKENFEEFWDKFKKPNNDLKYLRGLNFKKAIERIRKIKNEKKLLSKKEFEKLTNLKFDGFNRISKSMIIDYAGTKFKK